ncbi:hypothetical protein [Burkholderia stagnalis]|uniref:hypothetical protein n=1 Tax=Burkholderia stagnalis TaxID=1503054 RepID=UPI000B14945B|nr:hypothetical protein [Burkholderia stagnalis]MDY7802414.1 hypothetical protein [Burkholderia stagnalis]
MDDGVNRAGLPSGKKDNISKAGLCGFGRRSHSRLSHFIGFKFNIYLKRLARHRVEQPFKETFQMDSLVRCRFSA